MLIVVLLSFLTTSFCQSVHLETLFSTCYGQGCYPTCYRQPVLVVVDDLNIIVFAEGRNNSYCSGTSDGHPSSIRLRRSKDGGKSWSTPEQVLFTGNCDFLAAVHDKIKSRTHLFIQAPPNNAFYTYSDDLGESWSKLMPGKVEGPSGYSFIPGVSHGIQVSGAYCQESTCGGVAGRLIVPFVCNKKSLEPKILSDIACPGCFSCLAISDDHGATWKINAVSKQEGSRESGVVQLLSSTHETKEPVIYVSERNLGNSTGYRLHSLSTDGGEMLSEFGVDLNLPDSKVTNWTGIVAGIARFESEGVSRIVFSTPRDKTARADMTLYVSVDEAKTWSVGKLYLEGPAGYSDIFQLNSTHAAIVFENGEKEFAQRISFGVFDASNLN